MAASPRSLADLHDDVPHYPDRSQFHHRARFPSLSEFPDSPSVYSHAYQSPEADVHPHTPSFSHPYECYSDFDDEAASTIRSLQDDSDLDDFTDDASHRISLQGPRIRFHSRAPWETDDVAQNDEEPDNPRSATSATFGSRLRGKAARADNLIRTLARGSSISGRPSIDSVRSRVSATSSFEVTAGNYSSSRGALYDLAKESMSTSSLSSSATSVSANQQNFPPTNNLVKHSRSFIQSHSSLPRAPVNYGGMAPPSRTLEGPTALSSPSDTSRISQERSTSPSTARSFQEQQPCDDFVHPYANPDLVIPYTPSPETIPFHHPISGDMSGSDSNSTVADSTSIRSAAFSVASADTSMSRDIPYGNPRVNGKEISSPISVLRQSESSYVDRNTRFLSLHPPPPGFDTPHPVNPRSPTVALISLQEAQARERTRGSTVHTTVVRPFPDSGNILEDHTEGVDIPPRTRARSTSIGTRHKPVSLSPTQMEESGLTTSTNPLPGRALRHKKSGFMRLFTGRNSEGEKEKGLLPVPSPADTYPKQSLQIHVKSSMPTLSRVQKPPFSPTLRPSPASNPTLVSTSGSSFGGDTFKGKGLSSRKRQPPPLSIITKASDHSMSSPVIAPGTNFTPPPPLFLAVPQSAPPGDTDFPGLKLRPISTSFSSHFADMVAPAKEEPQREVHTPSSTASSSTALSPFTPASMRRSDDASATAIEVPEEEHLIIKSLQDQFVFAKKAWQQQIWELRGQIRDLTSELDNFRAVNNQEYCEVCGRGKPQRHHPQSLDEPKKVGVVNRPRARTGDAARFANGN